jgi:hypothetical protein
MGRRQNRFEKRTARLTVKKETLRALQDLDDDQLRQVGGGMFTDRLTAVCVLPSCRGC